jgi:hypothetical protein
MDCPVTKAPASIADDQEIPSERINTASAVARFLGEEAVGR